MPATNKRFGIGRTKVDFGSFSSPRERSSRLTGLRPAKPPGRQSAGWGYCCDISNICVANAALIRVIINKTGLCCYATCRVSAKKQGQTIVSALAV